MNCKKRFLVSGAMLIGALVLIGGFICNGLQYQLYSYACGNERTHYVWHWSDQAEIKKFINSVEPDMTITENSGIENVRYGGRILEIHTKESGQRVTYWMHGSGEIRKIIYDAEGNEKKEYYKTAYPINNLYSIWNRIDGIEREE